MSVALDRKAFTNKPASTAAMLPRYQRDRVSAGAELKAAVVSGLSPGYALRGGALYREVGAGWGFSTWSGSKFFTAIHH